MKVFISWSGDVSRQIAELLRDWLPRVIQEIEPFVSSADIRMGERWFTEIENQLDDTCFGLLCLTSESKDSPWLNFEAGALSKKVPGAKSAVVGLLYQLNVSDLLDHPLTNFQNAPLDKDGMKRTLKSLNERVPKPLNDAILV